MSAGKYDFIYEQGTDLDFMIRYLDSDNIEIDLTGYTLRGHIRRNFTDEDFIPINLTLVEIDRVVGETTITEQFVKAGIPNESFLGFILKGVNFADRTKFVYDIEAESPGGQVSRLINGTISISPEVTK